MLAQGAETNIQKLARNALRTMSLPAYCNTNCVIVYVL